MGIETLVGGAHPTLSEVFSTKELNSPQVGGPIILTLDYPPRNVASHAASLAYLILASARGDTLCRCRGFKLAGGGAPGAFEPFDRRFPCPNSRATSCRIGLLRDESQPDAWDLGLPSNRGRACSTRDGVVPAARRAVSQC